MAHHLDHVIASELGFYVLNPDQSPFKKRSRKVKLASPPLHKPNQPVNVRCVFDAYPGDRPAIGDSYQGEGIERQQQRFFARG